MSALGAAAGLIRGSATMAGGVLSLDGPRLLFTAFSVASVQALVIDDLDGAVFRHLDLPLAVVIALALTRPASAVAIGFVFGLVVDAFQLRLFGLHGLAYSVLGPVATAFPVGSLRSRTEIVASLAAVQAVVASAMVALGVAWADGAVPAGLFGRFVQVTLWSVAIVLPLTAALGGRMGLVTPDPSDQLLPPRSRVGR